jgi:arsenite methyltransferase
MNDAAELKACCASLYESELATYLLGGSFHPGGLVLTSRLGVMLQLGVEKRVLDVASGKGESALHLAGQFGCEVVGVDYSARNVEESSARATESVSFTHGDAERLPFDDASFDALLCECAFCTFPEKNRAASEFYRVLKPGGVVGLSDLSRSGPLPVALEGLLAWIACIADASPASEYVEYLQGSGFNQAVVELHDYALAQMVAAIQGRLLGAEIMVKLKKLALPDTDFVQAKRMAREAAAAVKSGLLGYALITARKPL